MDGWMDGFNKIKYTRAWQIGMLLELIKYNFHLLCHHWNKK